MLTLSPRRLSAAMRFLVSGGLVACVAVSITVGLSYVGLPFQLAFAVSYVTGITVHFLLHRHFTFAGDGEFGLGAGEQARRFALVVLAQYVLIAGAVALVSGLTDIAPLVAYGAVVGCIAIANFLLLSQRVFHRGPAEAAQAEEPGVRTAQRPPTLR